MTIRVLTLLFVGFVFVATSISAAAAELTIEMGPATDQQFQAVEQAVQQVPGLQEIAAWDGQVAARVDASTLSGDDMRRILEALRQTGQPFVLTLSDAQVPVRQMSWVPSEAERHSMEFEMAAVSGIVKRLLLQHGRPASGQVLARTPLS